MCAYTTRMHKKLVHCMLRERTCTQHHGGVCMTKSYKAHSAEARPGSCRHADTGLWRCRMSRATMFGRAAPWPTARLQIASSDARSELDCKDPLLRRKEYAESRPKRTGTGWCVVELCTVCMSCHRSSSFPSVCRLCMQHLGGPRRCLHAAHRHDSCTNDW